MTRTDTAAKLAVLASAAMIAATGACLAGCSTSSTPASDSTSPTPVQSTSGEAGTPAALSAPEDPLDAERVWLVATETDYLYDASGQVASKDTCTYDYDEHGNAKTITSVSAAGSPLESTSTITYGEYDESGYPLSVINSRGDSSEYDNELDERGRAVSLKEKSKALVSNHSNYTYWDSGAVNTVQKSEYLNISMEYDAYGYLVEVASPGAAASYTWAFSKDGLPVKCVEKKVSPAKDAVPVDDVEYSLECDDHGNIVKVLKDGQVVCERTYVEVENPSINAKLTAYEKSIL